MAVDVAAVAQWLGIVPTSEDEEILGSLVGSAVALFGRRCRWLGSTPDPGDGSQAAPADWPVEVQQAAVMQAARWFRRKSTPEGVAEFPDLGAVYVSRFDPDIAALVGDWRNHGF
jgi:hypothetical protein